MRKGCMVLAVALAVAIAVPAMAAEAGKARKEVVVLTDQQLDTARAGFDFAAFLAYFTALYGPPTSSSFSSSHSP